MKTFPTNLAAHCGKLLLSAVLIFTSSSMCHAAPANDNFSAAEVISGQTGSVAGTTVSATREIGEPSHSNKWGQVSHFNKFGRCFHQSAVVRRRSS